jgi:hypothetical protein
MEVTTSQGALLTLQLGDESTGIDILDITGLDPVKATIVSSSFANQDGAIYQSSRRDTRNIVMKLGLDPDPAVTDVLTLRRYVYSFFRPKSQVTLKFYVDDADDTVEDGYQISGVVESCESEMFTQTPEVDISIINFDPDFIDPNPVTVTGMTTADTDATYFPYAGTVETGITLTLNINQSLTEFSLYYVDGSQATWTMDVAYPFVAGDLVTISTVPGSKFAQLTRAGVTTSILYAVSPQSVWAQLAPGDNWFRLFASGTSNPGSIAYSKRFGEL